MSWDALRFCQDHGIPFYTSGKNVRPGWIHVQCPCCSDHSNHGGFNPGDGSYACWRCPGSHPHNVVAKLLSVPYAEAQAVYEEYQGQFSPIKQRTHGDETQRPSKIVLPGGALNTRHENYLRGRGFDPAVITPRYGLQGTGPVGTWEGSDFKLRIIIPIYDINGRLVNFQGRDITNRQELRYKGPPIDKVPMHHKHTLYGAHTAIKSNRVVVVEGVLDQWRMGGGFVCSFGSSMTAQQIYLLTRWDEIIFLFDPEAEAQAHAEEYGKQLSALGKHVEIVSADFGGGRDPGDLTEAEASQVRKELRV